MAKKADMNKETRLTICEGHDGTETSNGDVLIFPDMIRYRRLTHFDVDTFVEEVLVKDGEWHPGTPERLKGSYVFICSHGSRDRRCGVCGPALISRFKEEIELHGLQSKISVSPCSHIGEHKFAGNVIIFGSKINGEITGHWYGYVSPEDVPLLLEQHILKGEIVDGLWRGQMGLSEDGQKKSQEQRECCNTQENGNSHCCQNPVFPEKLENLDANVVAPKVMISDKKSSKKLNSRINSGKVGSAHKVCAMPTWFESWEREDMYAALAVVCAAASVAIAYSCYKQLR